MMVETEQSSYHIFNMFGGALSIANLESNTI
jgi:hypothetical protein